MILRKKCTACHQCELACSAYHDNAYRPSVARLFSDCNPTTAEIKGRSCLQTACAKCQEACPQDAIETREVTMDLAGLDFAGREKVGDSMKGYVLVVNEDKCTNCGDCYDACPYDVIKEHPEREKAFKCDLCDGKPQCITFCQNPFVLAVDLKVDKMDKERAQA
jgi:anaerobic carbon-monoxide dehydrogenase iron sulfur subunit